MFRKRADNRSLIWLATWLILTACSIQEPLPTRAIAAAVPDSLVRTTPITPEIPVTYTPSTRLTPTDALDANPPEPEKCAASGRVELGQYTSEIGGTAAYRIYLPPCYGENNHLYPTLYMLPGNDQTDAIWDDLGLDETAEKAIKTGGIPPLIIVMPDGGWIAQNSSGGPDSYEAVILDDLIPYIETNYCASSDPAMRAIGGLSRGGYWALEMAFRHPETFASVGGHSASLLDIAAGPAFNPQFTGLNNELGHLRIYLDIGAVDGGIANTRRLHEDMAAQGVPHEWVLNDGGHDNAYWSAHLAEYLTWYTDPWLPSPNLTASCLWK